MQPGSTSRSRETLAQAADKKQRRRSDQDGHDRRHGVAVSNYLQKAFVAGSALGYRQGPVADDEALRVRDSANSSATVAAFLAPHLEKVRRYVTNVTLTGRSMASSSADAVTL